MATNTSITQPGSTMCYVQCHLITQGETDAKANKLSKSMANEVRHLLR